MEEKQIRKNFVLLAGRKIIGGAVLVISFFMLFGISLQAQTNTVSTETSQSESQEIAGEIPPEVTNWFTNVFAPIEQFRKEQAMTTNTSLAQEIAQREQMQKRERGEVEEHRDELLNEKTETLWNGAGDRVHFGSFWVTLKIIALRIYSTIVTYPIIFYSVAVMIVILLLGRIYSAVVRE